MSLKTVFKKAATVVLDALDRASVNTLGPRIPAPVVERERAEAEARIAARHAPKA